MTTNEECPICFYEFQFVPEGLEEPYLPHLTDCDHIFHYRCLLNWAHVNQTCPMCRYPTKLNVIRSTVYIHSENHFRRVELICCYDDPIGTVLQLVQEAVNIPKKHIKPVSVHLRQSGVTLEIIPIGKDLSKPVSRIMRRALRDIDNCYLSFRFELDSSMTRRVDKKPKKFEFTYRSVDNSPNFLEMKKDPVEDRDDCIIL